ncbi:MAG TPA: DNA polymerase IV [Solirubrobacteraceae bacterium]
MAGLIAHLDLDAFYANVELRRRPELKGLPLIVAGSGPRAVVTTASYEARRFGVGSAMPAARARRLCPEAVVIPPDFGAYREVSQAVMAILRAHVERVEQLGLDEAYLDLGDLHSPKAAMRRLVADIRVNTGMSASVGIGPNRLVAKVASDAEKPAGFVVLTREQACARFAQAAPGLLPGIGPKMTERLAALGITTLAQLGAADERALTAAFGPRQGPWLRERGRFIGSDDVEPVRAAVSESRETTFDHDIADAARLEEILARLGAELCDGLRRHGRRGRTIAIKVRLDDWTTVTRARTTARPTDDTAQIVAVALELLREYAPARPVRLLGVRVAGFAGDDEPAAVVAGQLELPV